MLDSGYRIGARSPDPRPHVPKRLLRGEEYRDNIPRLIYVQKAASGLGENPVETQGKLLDSLPHASKGRAISNDQRKVLW